MPTCQAGGPRQVRPIREVVSYIRGEDVPIHEAESEVLSTPSHEDAVLMAIDTRHLAPAIKHALGDRARDIMMRRWLSGEREHAETIARDWKITPERVRQIERQSLLDLRAWLEGGTTSFEISRRRKALANRRRLASTPWRMRADRESIKGVDLTAARPVVASVLPKREAALIELRYFSGDRVRTYREIAHLVGVSVAHACTLEGRAFETLRTRFPALAEDGDIQP